MTARLRAVSAVAALAVLDALRRKDMYVMAILCGLMIAAGRVLAAVGLWGLETVIKDITFTAVSLCSIVLCILLAVRQVPEEISRRTLYPLLARPIDRAELLLGKFLGTLFMSWAALLLAFGVALLSLLSLKLSVGPIVVQYLLLRAFALAPIAAFAICLSLYLTPSAAVLVCSLLTLGAATFARISSLVDPHSSPFAAQVLRTLDWLMPRLDLFDLGKKVTYGWQPIAGWAIAAMAVYALIYTVLPLTAAVFRFRRMAL
jgi:ABC-type transport system involved in multi-copper enzyme maturation permease subunit